MISTKDPNAYAHEMFAETCSMVARYPWCHWFHQEPWWKRWLLQAFAPTDFDHTGNWFSFRSQRYYW